MKKKTLWSRVFTMGLAFVMLLGAVGALSYDFSGDGKTNVWDLQVAVNENKTADEKAGALKEALGNKGDELKPNANGEYEIWSALGLYNMAEIVNADKDTGVTFRLMADIDLQGADWNGDLIFHGVLEGDGHVISNLIVNDDTMISSGACAQGFFAKIARGGTVRNLKLENITVEVQEDSRAAYIGLLTGSLLGEINNCTTVGQVIDRRSDLTNITGKDSKTGSATCYIGTLAGRVENVTDNPAIGVTITDSSILMTAESDEVAAISGKRQKVLCKMGMDLTTIVDPDATDEAVYKRQLGIVGWAPNYDNIKSYNWQDISGACTVEGGTGKVYNLEDPLLTARRQAAVDKMYEICTVQWTPSQDMIIFYYKNGTGSNESGKLKFSRTIWKKGVTYYGMPYNHGSGSLERFNAYTQEGSNGVRVVSSDLPAYAFYYIHPDILKAMNTDGQNATMVDTNWTTYGKTNTAELIKLGVITASGNVLSGYNNITHQLSCGYLESFVGDQPITDTLKGADHAGWCRYLGNDCSQAIAWAWREVVSCDVANGGTVISGVTQMCPTLNNQTLYGVRPVGDMVPAKFNLASIEDCYNTLGTQGFMSLYAQASRGDGLICEQTAGAHSRMLAYDPICIRNHRGVINGENSYLITHEQGNSKNEYTTCNWNRVTTFNSLLDDNDHEKNNADGKGANCAHYFPTSINAFHNVDNKAVTSNVTYKDGVVKSNFYIVSLTVDGVETFPAIGQHQSTNTTTRVGSGYRDAHIQENLKTIYGDITGKVVTVLLSNGETYTVNCDAGTVTKN